MPKYTAAIVFTKRGNLLPWAHSQQGTISERAMQEYAKEREIQLVLQTRYERGENGKSRLMCRIKCPVSPLPVKGEFEAPSYGTICYFLRENGWEKAMCIGSSFMFD